MRAWDRYAELSALLKDDAFGILKELRYVRSTTNPERLKLIDKDAEKRAIETARYVVPIGAFTSMVHTVSGIVLHRLHRMMNTGDAPYEARQVISEMVRLVKEWDPYFFEKVGSGADRRGGCARGRVPVSAPGGGLLRERVRRAAERALVAAAGMCRRKRRRSSPSRCARSSA